MTPEDHLAISGSSSRETSPTVQSCKAPDADLYRAVERVDILPYQSEKVTTRYKQDMEALALLQNQTIRVESNGVDCYATPLIHKMNAPKLQAPKESVLPSLRRTERRLLKNPQQAAIYDHKINKYGYVKKLSSHEVVHTDESSFIPHHLVEHNGKPPCVMPIPRADHLLPGPILGPSLMGVLLCFRQHSVTISGDINAMFHQVRFLAEDRPLLHSPP